MTRRDKTQEEHATFKEQTFTHIQTKQAIQTSNKNL